VFVIRLLSKVPGNPGKQMRALQRIGHAPKSPIRTVGLV